MLFSQRQVEFAKLYSSKLFILGGLRRLANNPRALYGRSKTLFFDANLKGTDETQTLAVGFPSSTMATSITSASFSFSMAATSQRVTITISSMDLF